MYLHVCALKFVFFVSRGYNLSNFTYPGCEDLPALPQEANTSACAIRGVFLLMNVGLGNFFDEPCDN